METLARILLLILVSEVHAAGEEGRQFFYDPVPTTLTGTVEKGPGDPGGNDWVLRLERAITVNPKEGSDVCVLEREVKEVQLMGDSKLIEHAALKKGSVTFHGKLSHAGAGLHPCPVRMQVSAYRPVSPPVREILPSPDGRFFVAWLDHDEGPPIGEIRSIFLRSATDQETLFSFVSSPRDTRAAWNPSSTCCVIADAPDNGGPRTWLVSKPPENEDGWKASRIEPFAELEQAHLRADPEVHHLFRPSFSKIEWLSDTKVRFRARCNSGNYLLTMDVASADKATKVEKLPDDPAEK